MGLPPAAVRSYAHQLLTGLACLHDTHAVVHRDVKPSNTLLQQSFVTRTGKVRGLGGRGGQSAAGEARMRGGGAAGLSSFSCGTLDKIHGRFGEGAFRALVRRDVKPTNTLLQQPFLTRTGKVRSILRLRGCKGKGDRGFTGSK